MDRFIYDRNLRHERVNAVWKNENFIKSFGKWGSLKNMDVVRVAIKSKYSDMNYDINEFNSEICRPIEEQNINVAEDLLTLLWNSDLADFNLGGLHMKIDVLIGSQDYYNFVEYRQIKGNLGLTVILSA